MCGCRGGQYLNFDLAYPSSAIPSNFFPSNEKLYGYKARVPAPWENFHTLLFAAV